MGEGWVISIMYMDSGNVIQIEFNVVLLWWKEVSLLKLFLYFVSVMIVNIGYNVICLVIVVGVQVCQCIGVGLIICDVFSQEDCVVVSVLLCCDICICSMSSRLVVNMRYMLLSLVWIVWNMLMKIENNYGFRNDIVWLVIVQSLKVIFFLLCCVICSSRVCVDDCVGLMNIYNSSLYVQNVVGFDNVSNVSVVVMMVVSDLMMIGLDLIWWLMNLFSMVFIVVIMFVVVLKIRILVWVSLYVLMLSIVLKVKMVVSLLWNIVLVIRKQIKLWLCCYFVLIFVYSLWQLFSRLVEG